MKIIQASINELNTVAELFNAYMVFYEQPSNITKYTEYLKERIQNNEATIFLALNDNKSPAGFVLNYPTFSSVSLGKIITLNDLFVAPNSRKKGVGEALINRVFDFAKETGAVRVDLGTAKTNLTAQKIYERIGFEKDTEYFSYSYIVK